VAIKTEHADLLNFKVGGDDDKKKGRDYDKENKRKPSNNEDI